MIPHSQNTVRQHFEPHTVSQAALETFTAVETKPPRKQKDKHEIYRT
jgi:hypothetical protein